MSGMESWTAQAPELLIHCRVCGQARLAAQLGSDYDNDPENGPPTQITFVRCNTCTKVCLTAQEDFGDGLDDPVVIWPQDFRPVSHHVPEALRREHEEARTCFDAKAYTAVVVMVRRTLEGVCSEQGSTKRPLVKALEELRDANVIDERLFQWGNALRVVGNEGAHFTGNKVSREDAADALAFSDAFLEYLYVLTAKFEEFKKRRGMT